MDVEALYGRYAPMVLRRCRALLGDEEEAVEAMQDTFVQLLRRRDLAIHAPSSLLYTTATHLCLNRIRSRRRRPEDASGELLERIASAPDIEDRVGATRVLDRIFAREQPSTRVIATLFLVDGMTWEEVAAEVGLSVSGVRKRVRTLRENVAELEGA